MTKTEKGYIYEEVKGIVDHAIKTIQACKPLTQDLFGLRCDTSITDLRHALTLIKEGLGLCGKPGDARETTRDMRRKENLAG